MESSVAPVEEMPGQGYPTTRMCSRFASAHGYDLAAAKLNPSLVDRQLGPDVEAAATLVDEFADI